MNNTFKNNANLTKLLISFVLLVFFNLYLFAQESDPISDAIQKEHQETEGINLNKREQRDLERINKKYGVSDKEKELRLKQESGQKLGFSSKFRLGRANRKSYMLKKKMDKFNRSVILNRQNEETRKRMVNNEKRIKKRDKKIKQKQRRKRFLNLFR